MLKKLMKHEFRATGRIMLPVYLATLILAVFANISMRMLDRGESFFLNALAVLLLVLFFFALFSLGLLTLVIMIQRFYKNYMTDEGYLMCTLPVSTHQLIWSKLLVSAVWFIATALTDALGLLIMSFRAAMVQDFFRLLRELFESLSAYYALNGAAVALLLIALVLLGIFGSCLLFYAAIAVGHSFSSHKILLSLIFFFAFQLLLQILGVSLLAGVLLPVLSSSALPGWMGTTLGALYSVLGACLLLEAAVDAVFYGLTYRMMSRHLNLQ